MAVDGGAPPLDDFDRALVRRRRSYFLSAFVGSAAGVALGCAMTFDPATEVAGYLGLLICGILTVQAARLLLAPAARIVEMPASLFYVVAPDDPPTPRRAPPTWPFAPRRRPDPRSSGVWDRELDESP